MEESIEFFYKFHTMNHLNFFTSLKASMMTNFALKKLREENYNYPHVYKKLKEILLPFFLSDPPFSLFFKGESEIILLYN